MQERCLSGAACLKGVVFECGSLVARQLYLLVWSCNLKDIQLKSNLTDIVVDPGDHEMAHGLGRGRVDKVGAVLHGVRAAHVLKVAANSKP